MCFTILSIWSSDIESKLLMVLNPSALIAATVVALTPMRVNVSLEVTTLAAFITIVDSLLSICGRFYSDGDFIALF
jgi:hypothetical protein